MDLSRLGPGVLVAPHPEDRPLFIMDLAMPRDVDPSVHEMDGVFVYDLDALQAMR